MCNYGYHQTMCKNFSRFDESLGCCNGCIYGGKCAPKYYDVYNAIAVCAVSRVPKQELARFVKDSEYRSMVRGNDVCLFGLCVVQISSFPAAIVVLMIVNVLMASFMPYRVM
jgi:hypothetical protein